MNLKAFLKSNGVSSAVATSMESDASGANVPVGGSSLKAAVVTPMGLSEDSSAEYADRFPKVFVLVWTMDDYFNDSKWVGQPKTLAGDRMEIIQLAKRHFARTVVIISGTSQLWQSDARFDEEAGMNRRIF